MAEAAERPTRPAGRFRRYYGDGPAHLVGLLLCFLVAGYAVLRWLDSPSAVRLVVWFAGAVIGHDLIAFPLYSLADRVLQTVLPVRSARRPRRVPLINHIRVPALFAGLLLLLEYPLIAGKSAGAYQGATGLDTSPYLDRWLAITAVLFGVSAVLYLLRLARAGHAPRSTQETSTQEPGAHSPRSGADANS